MTPDDARLVALLAVFARERAPALVALLSHAEAAGLPEGVARAAAGSRGERLAALEAALGAGGDPTSRSEVLEALLSAERPARAADLRALHDAPSIEAPHVARSAGIARLLQERLDAGAG